MKFDALGGSGRHLDASGRLLGDLWRHLGGIGRLLGGIWRHLGSPGTTPGAGYRGGDAEMFVQGGYTRPKSTRYQSTRLADP